MEPRGEGQFALKPLQVLAELDDAVKRFYVIVEKKFPDKVAIAARWGKKRPVISTGAYLLMDCERAKLDKMMDSAADSVMSPEADGMVTFDATTEQIHAVSTGPVDVARKLYPQSFDDVLRFAKTRYPGINWNEKSKYDSNDILEARRCVKHDLAARDDEDEKVTPISGHTDYALIVAAGLEGQLILDHTTLYIATSTGLWDVKPVSDALHGIVRAKLLQWGKSIRAEYKNGKVRFGKNVVVPRKLKDHGFLSSVIPTLLCKYNLHFPFSVIFNHQLRAPLFLLILLVLLVLSGFM